MDGAIFLVEQAWLMLSAYAGLLGPAGVALGILVAVALLAGLVLVHEYGHQGMFALNKIQSRVVLLPMFHPPTRQERGALVWLSLGACVVQDGQAHLFTPRRIRMSACAGPLAEAAGAAALLFCLLPATLSAGTQWPVLAFALLSLALAYPLFFLLNWLPVKRLRNDGYLLWSGCF